MSHNAELIAVGTELLLGNIANTDAQMLSKGLSALGINVIYPPVVGAHPARLTAAPDGTPYGGSVELAGYDTPTFRQMLSAGRAAVVIDTAELWTDYADPGSPDPAEAAEGRRRQEVLEALGREREIPAPAVVSEVYELPCTSWFPGSDANALIRTEDGAWYFVELSGRNNGCVPELTELTALRGLEISSQRWCTPTREEDGGRVFLVASLPGGGEFVAYGY